MKKIIKNGDIKEEIIFECPYCDCGFKSDEYMIKNPDGEFLIEEQCPNCGYLISKFITK